MKHYYKCALSFTVYMKRDPRIEELFHMLITSNTKKVSVSFFISSSHIPSKCGKKKIRTDRQYSTEVPNPFEVLLTSYCFIYLVDYWFAKERGKRVFKNSPFKVKPSTANRVGYIVQLLLNAWNSLARRIGMVKCSMLIAPYILFNETTCQFYYFPRARV